MPLINAVFIRSLLCGPGRNLLALAAPAATCEHPASARFPGRAFYLACRDREMTTSRGDSSDGTLHLGDRAAARRRDHSTAETDLAIVDDEILSRRRRPL